MSLSVSSAFESGALGVVLSNGSFSPQVMVLFKNDVVPDEESVKADFTPADFSGFAAVNLTAGWNIVADVDGYAEATHNVNAEFEHNGGGVPNNIYGYYVLDPTGTFLLWAERFDAAPVVMSDLGDKIIITPKLTMRSEFGQVP